MDGRFGPYFSWEPYDGDPAWRPLAELLDAEVAASRVELARRRLSELSRSQVGSRVAASITFLGIASRLVSPMLGGAVVDGVMPLPDISLMWWRPVEGGPLPIACRDLARGAGVAAMTELVEPFLTVFRQRFGLSDHVLWGNVASALGGANGMIADAAPSLAARSAGIVEEALAVPPLLGMATLVRPSPARERWFLVRRNCCLYYRIPGGGMCGDCVLTPEDVRLRQWQSVLAR
ncbi:(2Fe-2S)-binding protein [Actinoplanes sp. TBRC 11911]|uniref:(2Fe-2S)-binding protein n=1 Tax=Actinoplanes sp. TBRC 11911 TaxID=2729386 RepID=UPI00289F2B53|nr:(2Fe-2S)-binding protein [Actinoplanes sp. TBRC 11911]